MELNELFKLIDAGFSKDEIMKLVSKPAEPEPEKPTPEVTSPEPAPAEQAIPFTAQTGTGSGVIKDLVDQLRTFNTNIQGMNVLNANMGEPAKETTMEDLIANIIMPPVNNKNGGK
jgi:hypothetical protein